MNKKAFLALASLTFLLLSFSLSSAYSYSNYYGGYGNYYGGRDYQDSYSYTSSRTTGSSWGPTSTKTSNYAKVTDYVELPYGGYEKTTAYVMTTTKSPDYYVRYHDYGYAGYNNYGYYPLQNYKPWYQKYWNQYGQNSHNYRYYW